MFFLFVFAKHPPGENSLLQKSSWPTRWILYFKLILTKQDSV